MEELIATYGYFAVMLGTFLEGETVAVLGGFAAQRGYLELHWVILAAFTGTLIADQLYFYLGRYRGTAILARRPSWQRKTARVMRLLEAHETLVILTFRFLFGLRTVAPFVIGLSRVHPLKYLVLNGVGAAAWSLVIGTLGYLFGQGLEGLLRELKQYESWVFAAVISVSAAVWLGYFLHERARAKSGDDA